MGTGALTALPRLLGSARSLAMYYAIPGRARRLDRLYAPFLKPGALGFDVGAHAGNRVRCWRRLGARVIAIEPQPDFVRLLRLLYGRDPDVTVVDEAVGRVAGTATLHVSDRHPTVSTLSSDWIREVGTTRGFRHVQWRDAGAVPVTTINLLIERFGQPDFVKLDIEGYEAEALHGLSVAVPALSFEYLPATREVAIDCISRLESLARYRFNRSIGESHRMRSTRWIDAAEMKEEIRALEEDSGSGDVYARIET